VSSIDGYQGREADVIIFVTVRSNLHCETGFLKDMRRLNVAMTRAKAGVIIIGDRATLTGMGSNNGDTLEELVGLVD
jgi:superfamily I DNA and/or RNA helicase